MHLVFFPADIKISNLRFKTAFRICMDFFLIIRDIDLPCTETVTDVLTERPCSSDSMISAGKKLITRLCSFV